jgi:hypothetical protein
MINDKTRLASRDSTAEKQMQCMNPSSVHPYSDRNFASIYIISTGSRVD